MSQAGSFDISAIFSPVTTLTGDIGGAISPAAGNIDLLGGNNITTTGTPATLTFDLTGCTQYALQVGDATGSLDSLAVGTAAQVLQSGGAGANPAWSTTTYPATSAIGDVIYGSAANTLTALAFDNTATRYLSNTGGGATIPAWSQVDLSNGTTGVLTVTQGGTGVADPTDHSLIIGSGAAAMTELGVATNGQLVIGSTGADPVLALPTNGTNISWTGGAGTLQANLVATIAVTLGGTGLVSPTDHVLIVGSGAAAMTELAVGATNQVLLGNTAADPSWGTVGNVALTNSSVTLSDGNNITVTGSPLSLGGTASFNLTGTTDHALQIGNATGSLTSLGVATDGQLAIGSTGADIVLAVPTNGTNISWTGGAGTLQADLVATVGVSLGGTGVTTVTAHALTVGDTANPLNEIAVGADNQVLLGNTAADPSWGAVPNAALANSSVTLSDGNNITVTGSPLSLGGTASFNLTGTTQYALQVGDATGSLDSLATGTATQMLQSGGAAAIPAWSTATWPATTTQGDLLYSSADNTVVALTKDATATRYLANTGASNNPAWDQVELTNGVSGILPVTNGGTGVASPTDHVLIVGSGAAAMTELAVGTTNQVLLGNTGADPSWGAVDLTTDITGTLPVANGGTGFATTTAYAVLCGGTAATNPFQPIASVGTSAQILTSNGAGALPTFQDAPAGGIVWSVITANQTIVIENGYIANKAGVLALALPATAAVGTVFRVTGMNTDLGWSVTQGANQQIHFGDVSTTSGAGGSVASTLKRDSIECVCVVEDLEWNCCSMFGNVTIV